MATKVGTSGGKLAQQPRLRLLHQQEVGGSTAQVGLPLHLDVFGGVVLVDAGVAAVLFWRAGWSFRGRSSARKAVYRAFTTSLLLWGAFLVADEVCIAYPLESTHLRLFVAHLVTLMAIDLLPEG